jgi:hypothetical protein
MNNELLKLTNINERMILYLEKLDNELKLLNIIIDKYKKELDETKNDIIEIKKILEIIINKYNLNSYIY